MDYIKTLADDFIEIHGDRLYGDDKAIIAGFGKIGNRKVCLMGHQKGRDTKENLMRMFGSAHPEGYRKAIRIMRLAEKFHIPIICFIDTPGAYPGLGAEERGQASAIAYNLREMADVSVPIIAIIIGEGFAVDMLPNENVYHIFDPKTKKGCCGAKIVDRISGPDFSVDQCCPECLELATRPS